ncbi:MAG: hypothetical protein H0U03_01275 [Actinobacteria bacterium]|nr:hypothetical protein [Actinomycetota bacterium]
MLSFVALLLDRSAALVLIVLVAALFGRSADSDTYFFAVIVPTALGVALSETLYTVLLPVFARAESRTRRLLRRAVAFAGSLAVTGLAVYLLALWAFEPRDLATWIAFAPVILGMPLAGVYAAFLTAERRYGLAIMRVPLATTIGVVLIAALLPFWRSPTALGVGVAIGQIVTVAILASRSHPSASAGRPGAAGERIPYAAMLAPTASVLFATLLGGLGVIPVERFLASGLSEGAIALLGFARGLALLPVMIPQALGNGLFPAATQRHAAVDQDALSRLTVLALRLGTVTALAAIALLVVCREELVQMLYQRNKFDEEDARATAELVAILAASLIGMSAATIGGKALFAIGRQRLVAGMSIFGTGLYVAAALVLRELGGIEGLAAAFSVASIIGGIVLAAYLARALRVPASAALLNWVAAPLLLAGAFAGGAWIGWALAQGGGGESFLGAVAAVGGSLAGGIAALTALVVALRGTEYTFLRSTLTRRGLRAVGPSL